MLGKRIKCIITGFTGIATAKCEYLNGCVQYRIEPPMKKDGSTLEKWVDSGQIKVVDEGVSVEKKDIGGPVGNMPSFSHP